MPYRPVSHAARDCANPHCSRQFVPVRSNQRYCTTDCAIFTGSCLDCGFPISAKASRCTPCSGLHRSQLFALGKAKKPPGRAR